MSEVTWGDMTAGEQRFMTEAFEFGNVTCIADFQHDAAIALEKRGFFAKGDNWGVYKITPLGRMFMAVALATEAQPAPAAPTGDGAADVHPSAFAQAVQGDDRLAVAVYGAAVMNTVANEFHQEVLELRQQLAAAQAANTRLANALEPFAEAWLQVPYGLRSSLRIWDGKIGDDSKYPIIGSISTDTLQDAHTAYFGLPEANGGEGGQ